MQLDPAGGAYDAPPEPIVDWGEGYPLPITLPARRLWRLELGALVLRPPTTQNPGYVSACVICTFSVNMNLHTSVLTEQVYSPNHFEMSMKQPASRLT